VTRLEAALCVLIREEVRAYGQGLARRFQTSGPKPVRNKSASPRRLPAASGAPEVPVNRPSTGRNTATPGGPFPVRKDRHGEPLSPPAVVFDIPPRVALSHRGPEPAPPPRTFGLGLCPSCRRKTLLLTSNEGPRCRDCHPSLEEAA
jgi:hypothetical protein